MNTKNTNPAVAKIKKLPNNVEVLVIVPDAGDKTDFNDVPLKEAFAPFEEYKAYIKFLGPFKDGEVKKIASFDALDKKVQDEIKKEENLRKSKKRKEPLPESVGVASMAKDGKLTMMFRSEEKDGTIAEAMQVLNPGDAHYDRYIQHVGGLKPGESKSIPPFED